MHHYVFRAWHKSTNKMRYDITGFECNVHGMIDGIFIDGDYVNCKDIILEQCLIMCDNNGVEIYEGDIVDYTIYGRKPSTGIIRYDAATAQYYVDDTTAPSERSIILIHRITNITVKGNIHEQTY